MLPPRWVTPAPGTAPVRLGAPRTVRDLRADVLVILPPRPVPLVAAEVAIAGATEAEAATAGVEVAGVAATGAGAPTSLL
jgi:hypothetical protein